MTTIFTRAHRVEALRLTPDSMTGEVTEFDRDFRLAGWMTDGWLVKDPHTRWVSLTELRLLYRESTDAVHQVAGYCPACGGVLAVDETGVITCTERACPDALAAHKILGESETEHLVEIDDHGFHVKHPLRERIDNALLTCEVLTSLQQHVPESHSRGTFRVKLAGLGVALEAVA